MPEPPHSVPPDGDSVLLRAGGDALAAEAMTRFSHRLAGLVRSKLGWRLRRKLDPEDVVQSVLMSFLRLQQERDLSFENWDSLWGLLALITIRKCGHKIDYFMAACRRASAEESVIQDGNALDAETHRCIEAISREPDPAQAAMLTELLTSLLDGLDARSQRIVMLALEGATVAEISDEVQRSERTVQRVLRGVWEQLAAQTS